MIGTESVAKAPADGYTLSNIEEMFRVDTSVLPAHVRPEPRALERAGMLELAGAGNVFPDLATALRAIGVSTLPARS